MGEDRGCCAGKDGGGAIGGGELLGHPREGGRGIVAQRPEERRQRARRVTRDPRHRQEPLPLRPCGVRGELARRVGHHPEGARQRALAGSHRLEGARGGRCVADRERLSEGDGEEEARPAQRGAQSVELLRGAFAIGRGPPRVVAVEATAIVVRLGRAVERDALGARPGEDGARGIAHECRAGEGGARTLERGARAVEELITPARRRVERVEDRQRQRARLGAVLIEVLERLDPRLALPPAHAGEHRVGDDRLPRRGPRLEHALVRAARALGAMDEIQIARRVHRTRVHEKQLRRGPLALRRESRHLLGDPPVPRGERACAERRTLHVAGGGRIGDRLGRRRAHAPRLAQLWRAHRERRAVRVPRVDLDVVLVGDPDARDEAHPPRKDLHPREASRLAAAEIVAALDDHPAAGAQRRRRARAERDADAPGRLHLHVDHHVAHAAAGGHRRELERAPVTRGAHRSVAGREGARTWIGAEKARVGGRERVVLAYAGHRRPRHGTDDRRLARAAARLSPALRLTRVAAMLGELLHRAGDQPGAEGIVGVLRDRRDPSRNRVLRARRRERRIARAVHERGVLAHFAQRGHAPPHQRVERCLLDDHLPRAARRPDRRVERVEVERDRARRIPLGFLAHRKDERRRQIAPRVPRVPRRGTAAARREPRQRARERDCPHRVHVRRARLHFAPPGTRRTPLCISASTRCTHPRHAAYLSTGM